MAYEKMHNIFDLAIRMQSSAEGISIADVMQQFDVSRRTAERMRNFIRERFPQLTETIGEHGVKRWHLPYGALKNYNGRRYVRTPSFTAPNITLSLIRKKNGSFSTSV